jgi:MFS transporter, DHA1 family, inner membrane transport protein
MSLPLLALFLATFAIATTEFAVVGLLPDVAFNLDVSIPKAGLLVSGYALGVAVGGPILTIIAGRLTRKNALLALMSIFIAGHILSAIAPSYGTLMAARIVASVCHASFLGIAAVVAANIVPSDHSARAVARVWLGFSAASLFGVPAATAIGHQFGWRSTFWAITAVGGCAWLAISAWVPNTGQRGRANLWDELKAVGQIQVLLAMAMSLLVCATTFAVFTYVAPLLTTEAGLSAATLPFMLFLFGMGGTAGLLVGGRLADWRAMPFIILMFVAQAVVYLALIVAIRSPTLTGFAILIWGFLFLAPCVPLQARVVKQASAGPNLASTLNQSAFNVGNAFGPPLGAVALWSGVAFRWLPLIGAAIAVAGASTAIYALRLERRSQVTMRM